MVTSRLGLEPAIITLCEKEDRGSNSVPSPARERFPLTSSISEQRRHAVVEPRNRARRKINRAESRTNRSCSTGRRKGAEGQSPIDASRRKDGLTSGVVKRSLIYGIVAVTGSNLVQNVPVCAREKRGLDLICSSTANAYAHTQRTLSDTR